jgi:hypothetical protein
VAKKNFVKTPERFFPSVAGKNRPIEVDFCPQEHPFEKLSLLGNNPLNI